MATPMPYEEWKKQYPVSKLNAFMSVLERDGNPPSVAAQIAQQRLRYEYDDYVKEFQQ